MNPEAVVGRPRLRLGQRSHDLGSRVLVVGVVEVAGVGPPPSARQVGPVDVVRRAGQLVGEGADVLGLVAATSGSGPAVEEDEELRRMAEATAALVERFDTPVGVASTRASVAAAAYAAGAVLGWDDRGSADPGHLAAALAAGASLVVTGPDDLWLADDEDVEQGSADEVALVAERARRAEAAGMPADRLAVGLRVDIDGPAAGVRTRRSATRLARLGWPLSLSLSVSQPVSPSLCQSHAAASSPRVDDLRNASLAVAALGVSCGARLVRTHDVAGTRRVCDALTAVLDA